MNSPATMSSSTDPTSLLPLPRRRRSSAMKPGLEDGPDSCRICRGEGTAEQPLFYPCKCSGSIKYVHQDCLMEWLSHSQKKYCELCKTPFRFTKLYDRSMPETVPWLLFLRQVAIHTLRAIGRWTRYTIVTFVWLCWLPWTIRQIWRALFWLADGSWLSRHEMQTAVEAYASHMSNTSSTLASSPLVVASNSTVGDMGAPTLGLFSTLIAMLGFLDPQILLRAVFRAVLHVAVFPIANNGPAKWDRAVLLAPIPRPPSLLSDVQTITSATRFPLVNNALVDILEGQLVCLSIVTAFILVFLIREWVINQQPLLNMPPEEQAENPAPAQPADQPRRMARRRRRVPRPEGDVLLQNQAEQRAIEPQANLQHRRRASENNILVQRGLWDAERPTMPQRAQSLLPGLEELEDNVRQLGGSSVEDIPSLVADLRSNVLAVQSDTTEQNEPLESPPLQRGIFDEVGQIQRSMEELPVAPPSPLPDSSSSTKAEAGSQAGSEPATNTRSLAGASTAETGSDGDTFEMFDSGVHVHSELTFRSDQQFMQPAITDQPDTQQTDRDADDGWVSDPDLETLALPQTLPTTDQEINAANSMQETIEEQNTTEDQSEAQTSQATDELNLGNHENVFTRLSRWLWHTEDYLPGEPTMSDNDETELVADIGAPPPLRNQDQPVDAANNPPIPQILPPNIQGGIDVNDPNAVDEAEDLEGVLELIGMEGPIAGVIQNIIFSVFLITLTLSASIWCPYIWGKITLLFVAHPFSVFVKAPLFLLSRIADFIIDIGLFSFGVFGYTFNYLTKLVKVATLPVAPWFSNFLDTELIERLSLSLSQESGARLEKAVVKTVYGFRPDLPTFSVQSHHVLRVFTRTLERSSTNLAFGLASWMAEAYNSWTWHNIFTSPVKLGSFIKDLPSSLLSVLVALRSWSAHLRDDLRPLTFADPEKIDYSLVQWNAKDKIICIVLGYILFGIAGAIYLKVTHWYLGLKPDEKVPGFLGDTLRQAGGVAKVIVIIGIEMIVFPLYCGFMLDIALLPLFEGATLSSRLSFFGNTPLTALFIHWFMGTCYMFHFALFVSMCRKVMRKGVLYFIRDPDDPSFHPVRDVLERPVLTQLGKIAFSAFVYGSLLVICLGGIIQGLNRIGNVLPVNLGTYDTTPAIPGDIVFFNFMLPYMLRKIEVSKKLTVMFEWWFRACAAGLRLTDFLFGIDNEDEKKPGVFLPQRFFSVLLKGEHLRKHPMMKLVEELSDKRNHLLWVEVQDGEVDEETMQKLFPSVPILKIMDLVDDKSKALVHFKESIRTEPLKSMITQEMARPDSDYRLRKIKDMKIDKFEWPYRRNTKVDSAAGTYVRAPAKDSVRIPKGTKVFLQVDEKNKRLDDGTDSTSGLHGRKDKRFSRIFVPTHFRARISVFIGLIWVFAATAGIASTLGPLIVGRTIIALFTGSSERINDLYALTAGMHAFAGAIYLGSYVRQRWSTGVAKTGTFLHNTRQALPFIISIVKQVLGLAYLTIVVGLIIPMALSWIVECYINIPIYTYLVSHDTTTGNSGAVPTSVFLSTTLGSYRTPIVPLLQTWAMGIVYTRVMIRFLTTTPHTNTRPATAIRAIIRNGALRPDVELASRALVLPVLTVCIILLGVPLLLAWIALTIQPQMLASDDHVRVYRYAYPSVLLVALTIYVTVRLQVRIENWRVKIRDEVYLIGERLHNFQDRDESDKKHKSADKGKGKERAKLRDEDLILGNLRVEDGEIQGRSVLQRSRRDTNEDGVAGPAAIRRSEEPLLESDDTTDAALSEEALEAEDDDQPATLADLVSSSELELE